MQQIILALVLGAALATLAAVFVGNAYQDPHTVAPAHSTAASQQSLATGAAGTPAEQVLAAARKGEPHRWRQVNHPSTDGDVPLRYTLVQLGDGRHLALGRERLARDRVALQH